TYGANTSMATHVFTAPSSTAGYNVVVFATDTEMPATPIRSNTLNVQVTVNPASVSAGGPYAIIPGANAAVTFGATALGSPTSYSWNIQGTDGTFNNDAVTGINPTISWVTLEGLTHPVNNSGTVNVTVTAHYTTSSGTVDVTSAATTLRIANVNPT